MPNSVIGEAPATQRTVAEIHPRGPFSLQAAAEFGFGANEGRPNGLHAPPSLEQFAELAERWRPFRTWTTVRIRPAGDAEARAPPRRAAPATD